MFDINKYKTAEKYETYKGNLTTKPIQIVVDAKGLTYYDKGTLRDLSIIAIIGEQVSEEYMKHLRDLGFSYVFVGKDENNLKIAMETLYNEFGIKN